MKMEANYDDDSRDGRDTEEDKNEADEVFDEEKAIADWNDE